MPHDLLLGLSNVSFGEIGGVVNVMFVENHHGALSKVESSYAAYDSNTRNVVN